MGSCVANDGWLGSPLVLQHDNARPHIMAADQHLALRHVVEAVDQRWSRRKAEAAGATSAEGGENQW